MRQGRDFPAQFELTQYDAPESVLSTKLKRTKYKFRRRVRLAQMFSFEVLNRFAECLAVLGVLGAVTSFCAA